jgi:two-component system KDP operon response regulator KdpE
MALTALTPRSTMGAMESAPVNISVLVIDDEVQMRRLIRACLESNGYAVHEATSGNEGIAAAIELQPGMVILDLGLPDTDGMVVLHRLREWSNVPIIVLSVRDSDGDKVAALDDGANDYLTKPFSTRELLARLRVLQRNRQPAVKTTIFTSGPLQVDLATRSVKVRGQPLKLARVEYALLRYLVQHAGRVLTHGQLLHEIWNLDDVEKTGRLRVYVTYLREKIETDPTRPQLLVTIPGVGYRLEIKE